MPRHARTIALQQLVLVLAVVALVAVADAAQASAAANVTCTIDFNFGCVNDTIFPRVLTLKVADVNSHAECALNCYNAGIIGVAGVERGVECWCKAAQGIQGQATDSTQCNIPCADDPGSPCGGVSAITQFQFSCDAPAPPAPAPPPGGCTTSLNLGCFMDPPTTMPYAVGQANSYEECAKACYQRGLLGSAGVKDGSSCMCSAEAGSIGTPAYGAGICNTPCKANSTETCGSSNSINQFTFTCGIRYACIDGTCQPHPSGPFTGPLCNKTCTATRTDKNLYYIGGSGTDSVSGEVFMYNVSTNSWKVTTPMPTPRQAAGFAVDPVQARAFVVGGNGVSIFAHLEPGDPRVALAAVHFFDAHDQSWTALQGLPHGVYAPGVAVFNNTLYVFGGMDNFLNPVSDVWALPLDQPGASWVAKSSMPLEIGGFSLAALDDNIYVLGGAAGSSNSRHYVAKTMVYNVPNNSWVTLQADMPTPVVYAGAALGANSTIVVVGGGKQDSQNVVAVDVVQQYLPSQDKYQTLASLYGARNCVSAAQFSDQFIFTVGGFGVGATAQTTNGNNLLRDVDMYDFVSKRWSTRAPLPLPRANGALVVM